MTSPLELLAEEISNNDGPSIYEALAPILSHTDFVALGHLTDLCPTHYCDAAICRDDQAHCYEEAS